jgi:hypothetical protein
MGARHSPTVVRRRLGAALRPLRQRTGLTCAQVAARLRARDTGTNWSETKVSRVETGRIAVHPGDIDELLRFYDVEAGDRAAIMELARLARQRGWWHQYGDALPDWLAIMVDLETAATSLRTYQAEVVPELLQTERYARAVLATDPGGLATDTIDRKTALRLARQELLTADRPTQLSAVVSEGVLHRAVGGRDVMREQLDHLARLAARPNVTLQVVPFGAGAHAGFGGSFVVLDFAEPTDPTVVFVDHLTGALYLEREVDIRTYVSAFEQVTSVALDSDRSLALITALRDA